MGTSKVIYGGETILDLTADTVTPETLAHGVTAHGKNGEQIIGTSTKDVDSTDANVSAAEILEGKTAYARGAKITGTMVNNEPTNGTIATKEGQYTIPIGYHDGSEKVGIATSEQEKIVPTNIRSGISILGVTGTMTGAESVTSQAKTVTPSSTDQVVNPDENIDYLSSVTVKAIPYTEAENSAGGITVTIG